MPSRLTHNTVEEVICMTRTNILLVEDEERLLKVLARTLEQLGYSVSTASTEATAVAAVLADPPDLMVLDVNLPDGTGWGVLRQLASRGINCDTLPTIVLSAGQPARKRIAEFHPLAFLPKPFPVDALKRLIAEALGEGSDTKVTPPIAG